MARPKTDGVREIVGEKESPRYSSAQEKKLHTYPHLSTRDSMRTFFAFLHDAGTNQPSRSAQRQQQSPRQGLLLMLKTSTSTGELDHTQKHDCTHTRKAESASNNQETIMQLTGKTKLVGDGKK